MVSFVFLQLVMKRMFFTCQTLFMIIVYSLTIFIGFFTLPLRLYLCFYAIEPTLKISFPSSIYIYLEDDDFRTINSNWTTYTGNVSFSIDVYNWINVKHEKFILSTILVFVLCVCVLFLIYIDTESIVIESIPLHHWI